MSYITLPASKVAAACRRTIAFVEESRKNRVANLIRKVIESQPVTGWFGLVTYPKMTEKEALAHIAGDMFLRFDLQLAQHAHSELLNQTIDLLHLAEIADEDMRVSATDFRCIWDYYEK